MIQSMERLRQSVMHRHDRIAAAIGQSDQLAADRRRYKGHIPGHCQGPAVDAAQSGRKAAQRTVARFIVGQTFDRRAGSRPPDLPVFAQSPKIAQRVADLGIVGNDDDPRRKRQQPFGNASNQGYASRRHGQQEFGSTHPPTLASGQDQERRPFPVAVHIHKRSPFPNKKRRVA